MRTVKLAALPLGLAGRTARGLGAMQQPMVFHADIDEGAEIHYVANGTFEFHPNQQIFHFEHV